MESIIRGDNKGSVNGMATSAVLNICQMGACKFCNALMIKLEVHENISHDRGFLYVL